MSAETIKPLRIVHTESSCGWGGQEIRILTEALGLMRLGHSVHLLCPLEAPIYREAQQRGVPVTALPIGRKSLSGLWALMRWLRQHAVDVMNTHSSTDSWLVALARLAVKPRLAVVRTRHVSAPIKPTLATRWLYHKGCDFVVTTGEKLRQQVIEQVGLPKYKVQSVPTGVDLTRFKMGDQQQARLQCGLPLDKRIIGIVATLRSWKGHRYLIEAVARLQRTDVLLLIVGDGPGRDPLTLQIATLGLTQQVKLVGNQTDVVPWLQAMDIFVLPSYANEGVPQSLMQAMACGIPVISTPIGSIEELIEDQVTGLLVQPQSIDELHTVLSNWLNAPAPEALIQQAKLKIQQQYSAQAMADAMQGVFQAQVRVARA